MTSSSSLSLRVLVAVCHLPRKKRAARCVGRKVFGGKRVKEKRETKAEKNNIQRKW